MKVELYGGEVFRRLNFGDCFSYENRVYMRIGTGDENEFKAVDLWSGRASAFKPETVITPIELVARRADNG